MAYEQVVVMDVKDFELYKKYREAMSPVLARYGGGFRYDFVVDEVLKSSSNHTINRVFTIHFADENHMKRFYSDPEYLKIRERFFVPSVGGATVVAAYVR